MIQQNTSERNAKIEIKGDFEDETEQNEKGIHKV